MPAGTSIARRPSPGRSSWASFPPACEADAAPQAEIPAWDDQPEDAKRVYRRLMENYSGFLEHTDEEVGRLVAADREGRGAGQHAHLLHRRRQRRLGRRRSRGHGQRDGKPQRHPARAGGPAGEVRRDRRPGNRAARTGRLGLGGEHAVPVDQAGRLALRRHAQRPRDSLAEGHRATRAGCGRSSTTSSTSPRPCWKRPASRSREVVNGVPQKPIEGVSMAYTFDDKDAPQPHGPQYFEMLGNRGIYQDGWMATTRHGRLPWLTAGGGELRRRPLGTLQHQRGLSPGRRPRRQKPAEAEASCRLASWSKREIQRAAAR